MGGGEEEGGRMGEKKQVQVREGCRKLDNQVVRASEALAAVNTNPCGGTCGGVLMTSNGRKNVCVCPD